MEVEKVDMKYKRADRGTHDENCDGGGRVARENEK